MSTATDERITALEARLAEIERRPTQTAVWRAIHRPILRRLAVLGLALALAIPGVVLASHRFSDVPTSHRFHADIAAIADAGITGGCPQGTNRYCPDGLVTRGQMAAFLNRLGALAPGTAPKVNAAKLQGSLPEIGTARLEGSSTSLSPATLDTLRVQIPGPGTLYVQVSGEFLHDLDNDTDWFAWGICDTAASQDTCSGTWQPSWTQDGDGATGPNDTPGSTRTRVVSVGAAGSRTFYLNASKATGANSIDTWNTYATVIFLPGSGSSLTLTPGSVTATSEVRVQDGGQ